VRTIRFLFVCLFLTAVFVPSASVFAYDFGLVLNQTAGYGNNEGEEIFDYRADLFPYFSFLIGDNGEFYVSAGLTFGYKYDFIFVPELMRTEFSMRFGNSKIRTGRMSYADPLSLIASGLFDGVQYTYISTAGNFSVGAWYTGLLYKRNANITMTAGDLEKYAGIIDYGDFYKTYFAPARLLASLDWEHPSIGEFLRLKTSAILQFDLTEEALKYHSGYLTFKAGLPVKELLFELGGSLEFSQTVLADNNNFNIAFAGYFGVFWTLPSDFLSRLSLTGTIAGGKASDTIGAFVPVTTKYYGNIFKQKLSGLSVFDLNYSARFIDALGLSASMSYFVRNDLGTYNGYPLSADSNGYFLGAELFARLIWSPVSDLQFNLGGGAFFPSMGDAAPHEKPQWRIELTAVLAVF